MQAHSLCSPIPGSRKPRLVCGKSTTGAAALREIGLNMHGFRGSSSGGKEPCWNGQPCSPEAEVGRHLVATIAAAAAHTGLGRAGHPGKKGLGYPRGLWEMMCFLCKRYALKFGTFHFKINDSLFQMLRVANKNKLAIKVK